MNFLEQCRNGQPTPLHPLHDYERTRLATVVSWVSLHRAAILIGVAEGTLIRAMQGEPVQDRTVNAVVSGLDALYDAIEPAIVRLARAVTQ